MVEVPLTKGKVALIDDSDLPLVINHKWHFDGAYARMCTWDPATKKSGLVRLHTLLTGLKHVDHVNLNKLDNRRENLRPCSHKQNCRNQSAKARNVAGFKGVGFDVERNKWRAQIMIDGRQHFLGRYEKAEDAARAYDAAARSQFGEFARPNFCA